MERNRFENIQQAVADAPSSGAMPDLGDTFEYPVADGTTGICRAGIRSGVFPRVQKDGKRRAVVDVIVDAKGLIKSLDANPEAKELTVAWDINGVKGEELVAFPRNDTSRSVEAVAGLLGTTAPHRTADTSRMWRYAGKNVGIQRDKVSGKIIADTAFAFGRAVHIHDASGIDERVIIMKYSTEGLRKIAGIKTSVGAVDHIRLQAWVRANQPASEPAGEGLEVLQEAEEPLPI